jgi:hypothetical protein
MGVSRTNDLQEALRMMRNNSAETPWGPVWGGERAAVVETGSNVSPGSQRISRPQLNEALTWENGELAFEGEMPAAVVKEVNRYNTVQIEITDPTIDVMRLSFRFKAIDLDSLVYALRRIGVHTKRASKAGSPGTIFLTRIDTPPPAHRGAG